LSFKSCKR